MLHFSHLASNQILFHFDRPSHLKQSQSTVSFMSKACYEFPILGLPYIQLCINKQFGFIVAGHCRCFVLFISSFFSPPLHCSLKLSLFYVLCTSNKNVKMLLAKVQCSANILWLI